MEITKGPSTGEWIKLWYVHEVRYYLARERHNLLIHAITNMNLKIMLSERN